MNSASGSSGVGDRKESFSGEWCVRAQLTISHPRQGSFTSSAELPNVGTSGSSPATSNITSETDCDGGNVNFQYTWTTKAPENEDKEKGKESDSKSYKRYDLKTRTAPLKLNLNASKPADSGYNTEQASAVSGKTDTGNWHRVTQPYDRRCRSTCTFTVTGNNSGEDGFQAKHIITRHEGSVVNTDGRGGSLVSSKPAFEIPIVKTIACKDAETQTLERKNKKVGGNLERRHGKRPRSFSSSQKRWLNNYSLDPEDTVDSENISLDSGKHSSRPSRRSSGVRYRSQSSSPVHFLKKYGSKALLKFMRIMGMLYCAII